MTVRRHLAVVGATASGKSALALALARTHPDIEVLSADAMGVYRGMDIGTAKASPAERREVRHHLIDLVEPNEDFSVARFQQAARAALDEVTTRGGRAIVVGGTGLYVRAVVDDLELPGRFPEARAELNAEPDTAVLHQRLVQVDPLAASRMEPSNRRRIMRALEVSLGSGRPFSSYGPGMTTYPPTPFAQLGIRRPPQCLDARIDARLDAMLAAGFLDEVRRLQARPETLSVTAGQALGYRELSAYLEGRSTLEEAMIEIRMRTRRFARRQLRWFRRDPRIVWHDGDDNPLALASRLLGD